VIPRQDNLELSRLEAFSDGVFAISITLLVLEIKLPKEDVRELWARMGSIWPSFLSFFLSFVIILIIWVNHHKVINLARRSDNALLYTNGLLLLLVTFIPFPTAVLGETLLSSHPQQGILLYCGTFLPLSLSFRAVFHAIVNHRRLVRAEIKDEDIRRISRAYWLGFLVYLRACIFAVFFPCLGLAVYLSLNVLWLALPYATRSTEIKGLT